MRSASYRSGMWFVVALICLLVGAIGAAAAETPRDATPEEQATLNFFRIPSRQTTDATMRSLSGGCDFNPFAVLESRFKGTNGITPQIGNGGGYDKGLNPALACRVAKLLIFAQERGCPFKIVSAYRATQGCGTPRDGCAAQGRSCHQYGLAADIGSSRRCVEWMLRDVLGIKRLHPAFGVHIAYFEGDYSHVHIQCNETRPAVCGPGSVQCDGRLMFSGDTSRIGNPGPPSSPLSNAVRNALGPPSSPPPPAPLAPPQALPEAQQPFQYLDTKPTTTPTIPRTDGGQNATSSRASGRTNKVTSSSSVFEQIMAISNPVEPTATSTTTPFTLSIEPYDIVLLQGNTPFAFDTQNPTGTSPYSYAQQTFTPNDLSWDSGQNTYSPQQLSALRTILATMKETLLRMLEYLKPFGWRTSGATPEYLGSE
ncbi:hypothetical protein A3A39_04710 [Candidatus Kaiserbacteria bacterium RIFCSPLOWO2_01_FULL_54_13]|uniref:Peptidase M15A C-terminal domain-containing protein n=1 Tax=Candidatus Kaiserbacteria bacterium RIFCSPLOWO2_01_FULL_54_13 TaxID=1798512 RepID=A0A1F6F1W7_9BACT|nr:MAG: hypothetical protein A3A39_04710 [Candidatus Kaiserbacteria bacterium RIFCSPLOWO2_01_FULL_54_13]